MAQPKTSFMPDRSRPKPPISRDPAKRLGTYLSMGEPLGFSNAVHRKAESPIALTPISGDLAYFSFLPGHWRDLVQQTGSEPQLEVPPKPGPPQVASSSTKAVRVSVSPVDSTRAYKNDKGVRLSGISRPDPRILPRLNMEQLRPKVAVPEDRTNIPSAGPPVDYATRKREYRHDTENGTRRNPGFSSGENLDLESKVKALEKKLQEQDELLRTLADEIYIPETDTKGDFATTARGIKSHLQDSKRLLSSLGPALHSRRGVLVLKSMQHQQREHAGSVLQGGDGVKAFDDALSLSEAADIAQALDTDPKLLSSDSTCIRTCVLCNVPRFVKVLAGHTPQTLAKQSEYSSGDTQTRCCRQHVCDYCLLPALLSSLAKDWWYDLGFQCWLKCPVPDCRSGTALFYHVQFVDLCRSLGDREYDLHAAQFKQCARLRSALERLNPRPTHEALRRAAALHRQLAEHGRMLNLLDLDSPADTTIRMMSLDPVDGYETILVPIFVNQFIRTGVRTGQYTEPLECMICTESPPDVVAPSQKDEDLWFAAIKGFPGDWTYQIRAFPPPSSLPACIESHPLNICRACLSRHISTQLDTRGLTACESLSCPSPGCQHIYTHNEVRLLATPETFARYDKLKLLGNLSTQYDFRWCLREGCGSGQIHLVLDQMGDGPRDRRRNHVLCQECSFQMCFKHQIPWHRGLSCDEYDRMQVATGTNTQEDAATQEWLLGHTKLCRCGAYVEKRGGCFHMTCGSCGFQFCWECMADWDDIQQRDPRPGHASRYNRYGHKVGCWFRGENAVLPTQMRGDTLEDALEMMRG